MQKIILATRNNDKLREIRMILSGLPIELISLSEFPDCPEVIEDGDTLETNALKKAREVFRYTNIPALADDTGLEVFHLKMAPGVLSARYAGEHVTYADNNRKLLNELRNVPDNQRRAQFRCVAAFIMKDGQFTEEGICAGSIISELKGTGGFGYDPLFIPDGYHQTFAELPAEIKNTISHRAQAFRNIKTRLEKLFTR
jgi:XTP/dITP diphosphohydrolase